MNEPDATIRRPERLAGEFVLGRKLGEGGFGAVFEAQHRSTGMSYALKRMHLSDEDAERFRKEALYPARIASRSLHVQGVHSFFHDEHEGLFWLVTELVPHGDLRRFLETHGPVLPVAQAVEIALGIAKGLAAIHQQGIVHRDLKPGNVLMDRKDDRWIPKIADFGLARSTDSVTMGSFASAGYAAPEQVDLASERGPGPESDLFSFGMMLYELVTGRKPTEAADLREYSRWLAARQKPAPPSHVRAELARWPALDALIEGLLERDRDRRLASADEVVRILHDVAADMDRPVRQVREQAVVAEPPASFVVPLNERHAWRDVAIGLIGVGIGLGVAGLGWREQPVLSSLLPGLLISGIFAWMSSVPTRRLMKAVPGFRVDANGIDERIGMVPFGLIPWDEVADVREASVWGQPFVRILPRRGFGTRARLPIWKRPRAARGIYVPAKALGMAAAEGVREIERRRPQSRSGV